MVGRGEEHPLQAFSRTGYAGDEESGTHSLSETTGG